MLLLPTIGFVMFPAQVSTGSDIVPATGMDRKGGGAIELWEKVKNV